MYPLKLFLFDPIHWLHPSCFTKYSMNAFFDRNKQEVAQIISDTFWSFWYLWLFPHALLLFFHSILTVSLSGFSILLEWTDYGTKCMDTCVSINYSLLEFFKTDCENKDSDNFTSSFINAFMIMNRFSLRMWVLLIYYVSSQATGYSHTCHQSYWYYVLKT